MSLYAFKIKKKNVEISLSSKNKKLIENEYNLFMSKLYNVDLEEVKKNALILQAVKDNKKKKTIKIKEEIEAEQTENTATIPTKLPDNFAQMLAEKSTAENKVVEKKTSELKNTYLQMQQIISQKHLENEIDYIVASAYCLNHYEKLSHFTEKQIKAKIAPFFENEIAHDFILDTVAKNFIKVLPDFTGTSDDIEYELTDIGEEYFLKML